MGAAAVVMTTISVFPLEHTHLGHVLARKQVVGNIDAESQAIDRRARRHDRKPTHQHDEADGKMRASTSTLSGSSGTS
jgi:hypothetical protein